MGNFVCISRHPFTTYRLQGTKPYPGYRADAIYATNKNRSFATKHNIKTNFKRKGKLPKDYQEDKKLLT
ncbi:MAG: hypothetical protein ACK5NB_08225 [Flavobacteriaceae bacterium]